jgi:hypothetical protein
MVFVADQYASEILQPGEESLHFPAAFVPPQRAAILRLRFLAVGPMWGNQLDPLLGQALIERVAIVGFVPNEMLWLSIDHTRGESWLNKGDFMRRSSLNVDGERKTSTVCHGHDLHTLAPLGRSHPAPPFLATTKVPSMKHSERSNAPRSRRSVAKACRSRSKTPERTQCWNRR